MPSVTTRVFEAAVDSRHRITLGAAAQHQRYRVTTLDNGNILLEPLVSIPARELDLWNDPELLASVKRGLEQAAAGDLHDLGDFEQYADDEV